MQDEKKKKKKKKKTKQQQQQVDSWRDKFLYLIIMIIDY